VKKFKRAKDIKVGVIGYGGAFNMGRAHINEMQRAGMTAVAVAEIDESRLEVAREDFPGIETYNSAAKMLKKSDVNLVTIITPHNTHAKLALQCLNAGRHVVCEKPLAITTDECDRMLAAAKKNKVVISTYHNRHWDGCILQAVDKIVKKKQIGDVIRIEAHGGGYGKPGPWWRSSKSISGGILYDWGVHFLEYALQLIDSEIVEVSGFAKTGFWAPKSVWKNDTNEDDALAIVRFKSGQWLSLHMSAIDSFPKGDRGMLEITGTKGTYIMNGGGCKLIKQTKSGPKEETADSPPGQGWKFYQNVADHLVKGTKLIITGEWARRPIQIIDLANKSAKLGKAIKAKYA